MADNTTITPGAGATIATDEIAGGVHVQKMKVLDGTPDSATALIVESDGSIKMGTDITSPSPAMPAGGVGVRGWLSALWTAMGGKTDAALAAPYTASTSVIGLLRAIVVAITDGAATTAITAASLPLPTGAATAVKQPALGTAGTASTDVITVQGIANGIAAPVKAIKDTSRTSVILMVDEFQTTATADTLINTMQSSKDGAAYTTGLSSYPVATGKIFRAQFLFLQCTTTTGNTTAIKLCIRLRANNSGACVLGSPMRHEWFIASSSTAIGASGTLMMPLPDGFEFPAGAGVGFSVVAPGWVATTAAPLVVATLHGYEYTP